MYRRLAPEWWARPEALYLASVAFLLCFVLLTLAFRRSVLTTSLNQRLGAYVGLVLFSQLVNRAHAWSGGPRHQGRSVAGQREVEVNEAGH